MARELLRSAAATAGITEEQAEAFVKAITNPTTLMCNHADDYPAPPFAWPVDIGPEEAEAWKDWAGLTPGEYNFTKYAHAWRRMCAALLMDQPELPWAAKIWQHPKSEVDQTR